jgi:hypothetical protein
MKGFGIFLVIVGIIWAGIAFGMNTTVTTDAEKFGSGEYSINVPSQAVHNLGLMEERQSHLMFSALTILSGVILIGFGSVVSVLTTNSGNLFAHALSTENSQPGVMDSRAITPETPKSTIKASQSGIGRSEETLLGKLLNRIGKGNCSFETYQNAISEVGGNIESKGFLDIHYIITLDGMQTRIDKFEDLQPWFLKNLSAHQKS